MPLYLSWRRAPPVRAALWWWIVQRGQFIGTACAGCLGKHVAVKIHIKTNSHFGSSCHHKFFLSDQVSTCYLLPTSTTLQVSIFSHPLHLSLLIFANPFYAHLNAP